MKLRGALQDALALQGFINADKNGKIYGLRVIRMQAVGPLDDVQCLGSDLDRLCQLHRMAVIRPVRKALVFQKWNDDLIVKALVVHVAADFGKTLLRPLSGAEEKIIHMKHIAVKAPRELVCKCGFARGTAAVDTDDNALFLRKQLRYLFFKRL